MTEYHNGLDRERDNDEIDLRELLALLLDDWRWMAGIGLAVVCLTLLYIVTATPVFETNALVQIEDDNKRLGGLDELSKILSGEAPTDAEIEIMRSRMVLGKAADEEGLSIGVAPAYFPVIGSAMARRYRGDDVAPAWLGLDRYAWGGERLQIERLDVRRELYNKPLSLRAGKDGAYTLFGPNGTELLSGSAGKAGDGHGVSIFVADLDARPGTLFHVVRHDPLTTVDRLAARLSIAERGKKTGIVELKLDGSNPQRIEATLNAITNIYLRQNVERKSQEAAKSLDFLNTQLPKLRSEANHAEHELSTYRAQKGTVDLDKEAQGLLDQLTQLEQRASELTLKGAEDAQLFTAEHPTMLAIQQQQKELAEKRAQIEKQIRLLPGAEQDTVRLMRDVTVSNELYTALLNRAQELKVARAGTIGNVRIVDPAFVPTESVKPKKRLVLALGVLLGGVLGAVGVFVRQTLRSGIRDPKVLERHFALPVYAIVPRSETLAAEDRKHVVSASLLAVRDPNEPAIESLRSLRTSIEFLFHETPNRILTIGGPAPDVGKSFVSANLGALIAQVGRRVLIVDADLRRGHLHRNFGLDRAPGLSGLIAGEQSIDETVKPSGIENLFVLTSGKLPPNPGELLVSRRFEELLGGLADEFDVVIVDAPPVLAASEAANLAKLAGINLLIVRSGRQNRREVELAVDRLGHAGASPKGFIFNDLTTTSRRYAYAGYRYYRYDAGAG